MFNAGFLIAPAAALLLLSAAPLYAQVTMSGISPISGSQGQPASVSVSSVSPASGSASNPVTVTINGSNFQPGSQVRVSGNYAAAVNVASANTITATLPAMSPGIYTVEVVNPDNSVASLPNAFDYQAALKILSSAVMTAVVGQPFNVTAEVAGGTAPYTWNLTEGSLPPGLSGTAQGVVSGAVTSEGTYNFTVQVTDSNAATATASMSIAAQSAAKSTKPSASGTALTSCQAINKGGAYYLANDVTCTTQGFAINADNVTLDLNTHTITYGSPSTVVPAVSVCDQWYNNLPASACGSGHHAAPVITNGTITQASNAMPFTHAIWIGQANGVSGGKITDLTINIQTRGTQAIFGDYPGVGWLIQGNTINDNVTNIQHDGQIPLSARSQFQGVAIKFDNGDNPGAGDVITGNTINGSPQGGIVDSNQNTQITNNVITLSSYYSNDYGVTILNNGEVVTGNVIKGRGRGIDAESSNFTISGNTVDVHEEKNNSEYGGCEWDGTDGIRIKNYSGTPSSGWTVDHNVVTTEATYCQAHGLRFSDIGNAVSGTVSDNSFTTKGSQGDFALSFSGVYQPSINFSKNAFAGGTCVQIDADANTDGANVSIAAGQTWSCGTQAVYDGDLTADGSGTYTQRLAIGDVPANRTITCGGYAESLVTLGSKVSKKCGN